MSLFSDLRGLKLPQDTSALDGSYAYPGGPVIGHFGYGVSHYAVIVAAERLRQVCLQAPDPSTERPIDALRRRTDAEAHLVRTFYACDAYAAD